MAVKITDLVDQNEIDKLKQLDAELLKVLETYTEVAKGLAKGLDINISVVGDIDKLEKLLVEKGKEATVVQGQLTKVIEEQGKVIANTTNTISRQLMEQERVNKTQRETYSEYEKVKRLLDQYHDTYEGQISSLVSLNRQLSENKKAQKDLEKSYSMGRVSLAQYNTKQAELIENHRSLTQQKRTLTQLMTAEEKAAQETEGSYAHMSQQLELLKKAYKGLDEENRNSDFGKEMEEAIQNLDAHLKDMAADMGEFQRNVGNYAIANGELKTRYEELVAVLARLNLAYGQMSESEKAGEDGKKLAKSIDEVSAAAKKAKVELDEQKKAVDDARKSVEESAGTNNGVKKDLKELVLEIANLTIQYRAMSDEEKASAEGQELSQHIAELTEKAGVLKDAITDTNAAITNASSDTRGFDQITSAIQLCIDGFGLATGAAEMLGLSEEDLAEIQTKLQAAIAASNAMSKIQAALQKQSALMQGVATAQTKLHTLAIKAETAAKGKGRVATFALTIAQKAFNAACKANPILFLVGAVIAAVSAIGALSKLFSMFSGDSAKRKAAYKQEAEQLEYLQTRNAKAIELAKARGENEAKVASITIEARKEEMEQAEIAFEKAKEAYDEDEDEYKDALEAKKKATEDFFDALNDGNAKLVEYLAKHAEKDKENALGSYEYKKLKAREAAEYMMDLNDQLQDNGTITMKEWIDNLHKILDAKNADLAEIDKEERKRQADAAKKAIDAEKKRQEALRKEWRNASQSSLRIIEGRFHRERLTENENYKNKLEDLKKHLSEIGQGETSMRAAINAQIINLEEEHQMRLNDILRSEMTERFNLQQRMAQSQLDTMELTSEEELDARMNIVHARCNLENMEVERMLREELITEEEAEALRKNIKTKRWNEITQLWIDEIDKRYNKEADERAARFALENAQLQKQYAIELKACEGNAEKMAAVDAKYQQLTAEAAERNAIETAKAEILRLEEILQEEDLTEKQREDIQRQLMNAKTSLADAEANAEINAIKRVADADQLASQKRIENARMWMQVAADSLNAINDLAAAVYDAKISKVEEEQEVNAAAGEAEVERITELVEKKVITEEEGEARKRAAEAQTAKKNEELEKKKQQLKHKQAIWDKANQIAQCGIATAMAIMQALSSMPPPMSYAMAAISGAMGAVQLATILATPIPKYAKGTDRHKGGPAIVGDGGVPELVIFGGKSWITPDSPTIVDLPAGAVVKPSIDGIDYNTPGLLALPVPGGDNMPVIINNDYKRLEEKMDKFILVMLRHSNRQHRAAIDNSITHYISNII